MELTQKHLLGLELRYCQPHKWSAGSVEVAKDLRKLGLMEDQRAPGHHPLTEKGSRECRELIDAGQWPPSRRAAA